MIKNRELSRIALCGALVLIVAVCAQPSFAQQQDQATAAQQKSNAPRSIEKNKYQQIEVAKFEVKEGVQFPENYLTTLMGELVAQFQETGKFKQVSREGESQGATDIPAIRFDRGRDRV